MILQKSVVTELVPAAALAAFCCVLVRSAMAVWTGGQLELGKHRRGRSLWLWLLPLFVCAGMLRAQQAKGECEKELLMGLDGKTAEVFGKVSEISQKGEWIILILDGGKVRSVPGGEMDGALKHLQVYVEAADLKATDEDTTDTCPRIGNHVRVRGECSVFEAPRNPGEFDYQMYYRSLKLNYRMFAFSCEIMEGEHADLWDRYRESLYELSVWASKRLGKLMEPEDAGIFRAALLGDRSGLSEDIRDMYQKNGIAHLLAVSGLHLSLVSLAVYGLFRRLGAGYGAAGLAGGAVLLSYALLTGASPSVVRALIMALCGFLAAYLGRTYDLMSALGLSALWLLWDSPYLLYQAGVQLSFGAIAGIGGLAPCLAGRGRNEKGAGQGFLLSVSMQLMSLPLILFHFFQYPVYGIFLNLLVVPFMGIVLASGAAGIALEGLSLTAGRFAAGSGCAVLGWYEWCCRLFERLPGSSMILGRPKLWQIGIYYGVLFAVAWTESRKADDGDERSGTFLPFALLLLFTFLLPVPVRGLKVTFLDVGQGDGICLQTRQAVVLVDGGSSDQKQLGEYRLEPFLKSSGIRSVDYWVVSHGDQDHVSGLVWMLENSEDIVIKNLILPAAGYKNDAYERLVSLAESRGAAVSWMEREDSILLGRLKLVCIYPEETVSRPLPEGADRNEHSLVLRTDFGGFHMLLTGDMSGDGELRLLQLLEDGGEKDLLLDIQVLKVAHHGSKFSSTEQWLDVIRPDWAVVSYGKDNRYGHPHEETVERLGGRNIRLLETARCGAVILNTDGETLRWRLWAAGE